ncbi:hypothetical protein AYI68_g1797 [Smittium mucronatum]|uniref:Uncharacterized protein n=1 Tax=Smittium mucronatum TaxID=133383 RepID=A0A1R0H4H4_9FUNG|nr:hypothetical protein AYI68_g1797 [Smittium mucronatum]
MYLFLLSGYFPFFGSRINSVACIMWGWVIKREIMSEIQIYQFHACIIMVMVMRYRRAFFIFCEIISLMGISMDYSRSII